MKRNYLLGPVTKDYADQNLHAERQAGKCLAFNAVGDLEFTVGHEDSWDALGARFPAGWRPDFIVLNLSYTSIAPSLCTAPIPLIGLAGDWNLLWHCHRHRIPKCDFVLTDRAGVEVMVRESMSHGRYANLFGCRRDLLNKDKPRVMPWQIAEPKRDIDVLFAGNLHPAVQRERLPWLGRLSCLAEHWNVVIRTGIYGNPYQHLLRRARIVFNRSIRGECNLRVFEAAAAGALLFQEDDNREVPEFFSDRRECIYYNSANLESLLNYFLEHEEERRTIADAARAKVPQFTFEALWQRHLDTIDNEWPAITQRTEERQQRLRIQDGRTKIGAGESEAIARTWQVVCDRPDGDPSLARDLAEGLIRQPQSAELQCALGLVVAMESAGPSRLSQEKLQAVEGYFRRAAESDPFCLMAGLNLLEALVAGNKKTEAVKEAQRLLALLAYSSLASIRGSSALVGRRLVAGGRRSADPPPPTQNVPWISDLPHFPLGFDMFRVEWERAAWSHAGDPSGEMQAKHELFRWRLHLLLADLTDDLSHFQQAALAQPDLQPTRGGLGCALARQQRLAEAVPNLRRAIADNPFDLQAARALFEALGMMGDAEGQRRLARERRWLCKAAPQAVPAEDWFQQAPPVGDELASIIILCCNQLEFTRQCLESVVERTRLPYELILVDNGSTDGTGDYLEEIRNRRRGEGERAIQGNGSPLSIHNSLLATVAPRIEIIRNEKNLGFAAGCNQALAKSRGRYIVFLNNDTIVTDHWLEGLIGWSLHEWPKVGLVGPVTNYSRGPQNIVVDYVELNGLQDFAARRRRDFAGKAVLGECLTGFCALVRREVLDQIGGLDERFGLGFFEDDDLCVRVQQAGYQLLVALNVFIHHFGSKTFRSLGIDWQKQLADNLEQFKAKWGPVRASRYTLPQQRVGSLPTTQHSLPTTSNLSLTTQRVSLCMIVKNEEANLPACLESAGDVFHEIIVVDTGSSDRTKEVAERYGAKVFDFPWVDSFSAARNESLRHATGDWTFWLDADDRLDDENRDKLRAWFGRLNGGIIGYSMKCLCLPDKQRGTSTAVDHLRLFPNHPQIRWEYRVHEQILPSIRRFGGHALPAPIVIQHTGYQDAALRARKHQRDLRLLELDYGDNPKDPFTLFNLGWIKLEMGQPAEAIPFLRESLKGSGPTDSIVRKLFTLLVQCHRQLGQTHEALETCESGRRLYPDDVELLFHESLVRREQDDRTGAEKCLLHVLQSREGPHFASLDVGLASFKARHNLAILCSEQGRIAEAEAQWRAALKDEPTYFPAWLGLVEMFLGQKRFTEAQTITQKIQSDYPQMPWGAILRARSLLAMQDFAGACSILEEFSVRFPNELMIWLILGNALLAEGKDLERAEEVLQKIIEIDPANNMAKRNLAALMQRKTQQIAQGHEKATAVLSGV